MGFFKDNNRDKPLDFIEFDSFEKYGPRIWWLLVRRRVCDGGRVLSTKEKSQSVSRYGVGPRPVTRGTHHTPCFDRDDGALCCIHLYYFILIFSKYVYNAREHAEHTTLIITENYTTS